MNVKPTFARPSSLSIIAAAALAVVITIGLLTAVTLLFQRDGGPLAQVVAAERNCVQYTYVSERNTCIQQWLAAARAQNVASK